MNRRNLICLIFIIGFVWIPARSVQSSPQWKTNENLNNDEGWKIIRPGIDFRLFHLSDPRPINIFVARMHRSNSEVTLESSIAWGQLSYGTERVIDMATRYDQAINYWGQSWGGRNDVAVAINGFFFDLETGTPRSGQIHSGWYAKRFQDFESVSGFAWTLNRTTHIGECVEHKPLNQFLTIAQETFKIHEVNEQREKDKLVLYTTQYGKTTDTDQTGVEILVEMTRPTLVLPEPAMALGYVREIRDKSGSTPIPFDHIVLSASGVMRPKMLDALNVGDEVGITQEISACPDFSSQSWTKTYASIGGDYYFLKDGVIRTNFSNPDAEVSNSRTAIAYNENFVYFIVVDAFEPEVSEGMNIPELGVFARDTLLATHSVTLDSGGSSTMVVDGQVVNNTHCNFTRDCEPEPTSKTEKLAEAFPTSLVSPEGIKGVEDGGFLQPLVANGMMMVAVEPIVKSTTFTPTEIVLTIEPTAIRLGPGTNYRSIGTIPELTGGEVQTHFNQLNGVLAKGSYWWKVDFDGLVGWVREESLLNGKTPTSFNFYHYLPHIQRE